MREDSLWLANPPPLSNEAACEMLDFIYEFIYDFELQYADQLRRPTPPLPSTTLGLFDDFDDDIP